MKMLSYGTGPVPVALFILCLRQHHTCLQEEDTRASRGFTELAEFKLKLGSCENGDLLNSVQPQGVELDFRSLKGRNKNKA